MDYKEIKEVPWQFKWRLTNEKYIFVKAFKQELSQLDDVVVSLYSKLWNFSPLEKTMHSLLVRKMNKKNEGIENQKSWMTFCHSVVDKAKDRGLLQVENCKRCGSTDTIAHHEDYRLPLEVTWFCISCHQQRHHEIKMHAKTNLSTSTACWHSK